MLKKSTYCATALIGSLCLGACSSSVPFPNRDTDAAPPSSEPVIRSELTRNTDAPTDAEKTALAEGMSTFAFSLLHELSKAPEAKKNLAFSPASVSFALSMAYAGAAGNTAAQMKDAMAIGTSTDAYLRSLNWLDRELASRATAAFDRDRANSTYTIDGKAPDAANYRLHIVNALWGERTLGFERSFLDTLATQFGAGIHTADFVGQPDVERGVINRWVSEETLNRINDLIPQGAVDSDTRSVLVNAIHLKLPWADPFGEQATQPATFTRADGSTVESPFMHGGGSLAYAEKDDLQAVAIPLSGNSVEFVVFLPSQDSSLAQFEAGVSATAASSIVRDMRSAHVELTLPKFKFTTESILLGAELQALGIKDAFSGSADFSGMTKEDKLFISDVAHKAMVGVDEHGVEAAAATAVMMSTTGAPTEIKQLNANRPFFFGIYDRPTTTWLFLGHMLEPSSE